MAEFVPSNDPMYDLLHAAMDYKNSRCRIGKRKASMEQASATFESVTAAVLDRLRTSVRGEELNHLYAAIKNRQSIESFAIALAARMAGGDKAIANG